MEQFIGIHMFMSIIKLPAFYMYWTSETRYPPVADAMSIAWYKALRENVHVSDNAKCNDPEKDTTNFIRFNLCYIIFEKIAFF